MTTSRRKLASEDPSKLDGFRAPERAKDGSDERAPAPPVDNDGGDDGRADERDDLPARKELKEDGADRDGDEAAAPQLPSDKRAELVARINARRSKDTNGVAPSPEDAVSPPFAREGAGEEGDDAGQEDDGAGKDSEANEPRPPESAGDAPQRYRLNIRGQHREVSRDELIALAGFGDEEDLEGIKDKQLVALAQKNAAAQSLLDESKQVLKSARRSARPDSGQHPDREEEADEAEEDERRPRKPASTPADEEAEDARLLQYGEPEEARKAVERIARKAVQQDRQQQKQTDIRQQLDTAFDQFGAENKDIFNDADIASVFSGRVIEEVKDDLLKAFPKLTRAHLDQHVTSLPIAGELYRDAVAQGHKLRPPLEVFSKAGAHVRTKFLGGSREQPPARREQQPGLSDRMQRKQALPQQPARAGSLPAQPATPPPSGERRASSVITQIRQSRGQPV